MRARIIQQHSNLPWLGWVWGVIICSENFLPPTPTPAPAPAHCAFHLWVSKLRFVSREAWPCPAPAGVSPHSKTLYWKGRSGAQTPASSWGQHLSSGGKIERLCWCMLVKICLKIVKIIEELPLLAFLSASAHSLSGYCIHISPAMSSAHPGSLAVVSTYRDPRSH